MSETTEITQEDARGLLVNVGQSVAVIVVIEDENDPYAKKTIMVDGVVWDYHTGGQIGLGSVEWSADATIEEILKGDGSFCISSQYFNWATGDYKLVD